MNRVPLFIEVVEKKEHAALQICRKTMAFLFKQKIAPLPFASSLKELKEVLSTLTGRGLVPSIFVVNTYLAEELLAGLDPILNGTPVLFFNRQVFSTDTLLALKATITRDRVGEIIEQMRPRKLSQWPYGTRNSDDVAARAAQGLVRFLSDGDFESIDGARISQQELSAALHGDSDDVQRLLSGSTSSSSGRLTPVRDKPESHRESSSRISVPRDSTASIPPAAQTASLSGLHGALSQMSVATVLSMLDMERKTGVLGVLREEVNAQFLVSKGRIVKAQLLGKGVPEEYRSGIEAIYYVLKWHNGLFNFVAGEVNAPDEINAGTTQLLMEAARRSDEPAEKAV